MLKFIEQEDVYYPSVLKKIRKSTEQLQPLYEAFRNALEAIDGCNDKIILRLFHSKSSVDNIVEFERFEIEDSGVGFNDVEYDRFKRIFDSRKGKNNQGSGRIQFLHFFQETEFKSTFYDKNAAYRRFFKISKRKEYIYDNNAIILADETVPLGKEEEHQRGTIVTFKYCWDDKDRILYSEMTTKKLKNLLLDHYIAYFCIHKNELPVIQIEYYINGVHIAKEKEQIVAKDIPAIDKQDNVTLNYLKLAEDGKGLVPVDNKTEIFNIKSFKIKKKYLQKNEVKFTSKDETVEQLKIKLPFLPETETFEDCRYLMLVSSTFLTEGDDDVRGNLKIASRNKLSSVGSDAYNEEDIYIEDIIEGISEKVKSLYPELEQKKQEFDDNIEKLKKMFLIDDETLKNIKIYPGESDSTILQKIYEADAKLVAKKDAELKRLVQDLEQLNPVEDDFEEHLSNVAEQLSCIIPLQNKNQLTKYVARRNMVLELFEKALHRQLLMQYKRENGKEPKNIDERIIHNILYRQHSSDSYNSNMWLINEDFIYFKGTSESKLKDVVVNDKKFFKDEFSEEELEAVVALGEDRREKRPDILLFPDEGKCVIIEFKNPNVNVSDHLTQVNKYASLLLNYSVDDFKIDTYYAYLIGEAIDGNDVQDHDSDFEYAYHFDYLYRPAKKVRGKFGRSDGSIYTEVIKYSTLLKRAKQRNQIFIDTLLNSNKQAT